MPRVVYLQPDGPTQELDVAAGQSLMLAAVHADVKGIVGECGGTLTCATCHVMVEEEFVHMLPPPSEAEDQMLDFTHTPRQPHSRFACQIVMSEALDGIRVQVAATQA